MPKRQSNRPDRRLAPVEMLDSDELGRLAEYLRYVGDPRHKLHPGDYRFVPPSNPRATKSVCDDLRPLLSGEAISLFRTGILAGMVSRYARGDTPKYVWAVGHDSQVYEAKTKPPDRHYHGYRLGEDEPEMRHYIQVEWNSRCLRFLRSN